MKGTLETLPIQTMRLATTEELKAAWSRNEPIDLGDPMLARIELSYQQTFFPLGFPLTVSTNDSEVLECGFESWGRFEQLFDIEPIQLNVSVTGDGGMQCPPIPGTHIRQHILSNIADAKNYGIADLAKGFSAIWATQAALEHRSYFRYFFLESAAMCQIANCHASGIHAACVDLNGRGVLLCGDSGAGKSTLSYACARAGWTYITDDGSFLVNGRKDRLVVGNCSQIRFRPSSENLFPELRGGHVMRRAEIGKPSIEIPTSSNGTLRTSMKTNVGHIVFLNRSSSRQELEPFPAEVARLYLLQRLTTRPEVLAAQTQSIDTLLNSSIFELHYSDLDWAVRRLEELVREGR